LQTHINNTISIGINLQNLQFEACAISAEKDILFNKIFLTNEEGYKAFINKCQTLEKEYNASLSMSIEVCDNFQDFKKIISTSDFCSLVFNILKYKKSIKNNDAFSIALILLNDFYP